MVRRIYGCGYAMTQPRRERGVKAIFEPDFEVVVGHASFVTQIPVSSFCWKLANWQFRLWWIPSLLLAVVGLATQIV